MVTVLAIFGWLTAAAVAYKWQRTHRSLIAEVSEHMACHEKVLSVIVSLDKNRNGAYALRAAAEKWDDPTNQQALRALAHREYVPGGPSMPAIFLRKEADALVVSGNEKEDR